MLTAPLAAARVVAAVCPHKAALHTTVRLVVITTLQTREVPTISLGTRKAHQEADDRRRVLLCVGLS